MMDKSVILDMSERIIGSMLWDVHAANVGPVESIDFVGHNPESQTDVEVGNVELSLVPGESQDLGDLTEILLAGYKDRLVEIWGRLLKASDSNLIKVSIQPPARSNGDVSILLAYISGTSQKVVID